MIGAVLLCVATLCSDDMIGRLDNQGLSWTASEGATYYVLANHSWGPDGFSVYAECASTNGTSIDTTRTSCYSDRICVKACKPDPDGGADLCSDYNVTSPSEILPFACLRSEGCLFSDDGDARNDTCSVCETPCFAGAPRRLPSVRECLP